MGFGAGLLNRVVGYGGYGLVSFPDTSGLYVELQVGLLQLELPAGVQNVLHVGSLSYGMGGVRI